MLTGSYNPGFVLLSLLVAVLAAYTALDMAARVTRAEPGRGAWGWLLAGGCAMGVAIWSMHFIGMLALRLPIPLGYDPWITLQSLLVAISASLFALWLVSRPALPHLRLALGALLMGLGIAWMHYLGMDALRMQPHLHYRPDGVALSIVIAVAASWSALFIAFRLRNARPALTTRLAAAVVMGIAIAGMHYTGMAAARFPLGSICGAAHAGGLSDGWMAAFVMVVTIAILAIVLMMSWLEQRMHARLLQLRNSILASSLEAAQNELHQAALHDPLTRLPNRRSLQEWIERRVSEPHSPEQRFAVMFMDLDGFRHVNDSFGHQTGDTLLVAVAERTRQLVQPGDLVARLGGDLFVLVVALPPDTNVSALASQIIMAVSSIRIGGREMHVTASIGIALYPDHSNSERQLMACADIAMHNAKQSGRNAHVLFAEWMNDNAEQQVRLLADLRQAMGTDALFLHYQPKVRVFDGSISGAEALMRWDHPVHGLMPPEVLIRLAERSGLIAQLGGWALEEACRQLQCWDAAGQHTWKISVNLSALQLSSPQLLDQVQHALLGHAIDPRRLILEVTESAVMRDVDASLALLRSLAGLGVGISIDDFGTGYSSLLYLKRLPATEIKIDHAFIRSLEDSDEDVVIVSAIVALGHALDMDVVAEGIETPGQRSYVERLGCDFLQGFLFGRPVNADEFFSLHAHAAPAEAAPAALTSSPR
ncbi:MAG: putative bifunctional diguanylate cyclase/phosphodiesterase [Stenotrophomonas sp.]